jgi:hypothetical protein
MFLACASLLLVSCRSAPVTPDTKADEGTDVSTVMRVVASGQYGKGASAEDAQRARPRLVVARDQVAYARAWSEQINDETPPAIDFSREVAVFLLLGRHSTGGHSVTPVRVAREGDALVVDATIAGPSKRAIVSMALTAPYSVIAVPRGDFRKVSWRNGEVAVASEDDAAAVQK